MSADHHRDRKHAAARSPRPERPPKPIRPPVPPPDDEDQTMRIFAREAVEASRLAELPEPLEAPELVAQPDPLPVPVPPPLPSRTTPSEHTPLAVALGNRFEAPAVPAPRRLYAKLGAALFAAGVLVGGLGALAMMKGHAASTREVAARSVPAPTPLPTVAQPSAPSSEPHPPPAPVQPRTAEPTAAPVPNSNAPTCEALLGARYVQRNDVRGAQRQAVVAKRAFRRGNVDQAQVAACQALVWDRSNVENHLNLGRLLLVRRDWPQAAAYGESALELDPTSRRALGIVGDALAALHKTDDARKAWLAAERKLVATPRDLDLIVRRDLALAKRVERLHDFALAERLYRRVLLFRPDDAGATHGVASCLAKAGRLEQRE